MAKLPTLNVDVRVNTRTMQKDIDAANKQLQNIGGKGLAFAGGTAGKIGSLGALGGGAGSAAIMAGAAGLTAAAPFMAANRIIDSFSSSVEAARAALEKNSADSTQTTWRQIGVVDQFAQRLAAASEFSAELEAKNKGFWDTFWASASNDQGQVGGIMGELLEGAGSAMDSLKQITAQFGATLGGKTAEQARIEGLMATAGQGASAFESDLAAANARAEQMTTFERVVDTSAQLSTFTPIGALTQSFRDLFG
jgi:hypothetical protein